MDAELKQELRQLGLLPLEYDPETRAELERLGIGLSQLETHNSPSHVWNDPAYQRAAHERQIIKQRLEENIAAMCCMESRPGYDPFAYQRLENEIRRNLPAVQGPIVYFPTVSSTGAGGVCRDCSF